MNSRNTLRRPQPLNEYPALRNYLFVDRHVPAVCVVDEIVQGTRTLHCCNHVQGLLYRDRTVVVGVQYE